MTLESLGYNLQFDSPYVKLYSKVTDEYGLVVIRITVGEVTKMMGVASDHPVTFTPDEFIALADISVIPQENCKKYYLDSSD